MCVLKNYVTRLRLGNSLMNDLKGQNLPIMNAVVVSLTLHALAGWVFLNIAQDMTNHRFVPPIEFFVVPPRHLNT